MGVEEMLPIHNIMNETYVGIRMLLGASNRRKSTCTLGDLPCHGYLWLLLAPWIRV